MTSGRTRKAIVSIRSTLAVYQRRRVPGAVDLGRRPAMPSPNMPNNPPNEGNIVVQQTDDRPKALKPALEAMALLVAAVIVHDKATNCVVLRQRSENANFAQGMWDLPVGKSEPSRRPRSASSTRRPASR